MIVVVLLRGENHPADVGSKVNPVTLKRSSRECLTKSRVTIDRQEADVSSQRPQHARLDS
jgi:hypothetical protein